MASDRPDRSADASTVVELLSNYEVRPLSISDAVAVTHACVRNREHLAPWEPTRRREFITEAVQRGDAEAKLRAASAGQQDPWLIWCDGEVVGRVNLTNIARGPFQSASLGYWVAHRHTGRGLATAAVRFAVARATDLGLHRLEASTLVDNQPSQAVLRRCGFTEYGSAPQYLFIAGAWQDHVMFQRILHDRAAP